MLRILTLNYYFFKKNRVSRFCIPNKCNKSIDFELFRYLFNVYNRRSVYERNSENSAKRIIPMVWIPRADPYDDLLVFELVAGRAEDPSSFLPFMVGILPFYRCTGKESKGEFIDQPQPEEVFWIIPDLDTGMVVF